MGYDSTLQFFGSIESPEALRQIASAMSAEALPDWDASGFSDVEEAVAFIVQDAEAGNPVTVVRKESRLFRGLPELLTRHGVAWVMEWGAPGSEWMDHSMAWEPGMPEPVKSMIDGDQPLVPLDEVKAAAANGVEGLEAFIEEKGKAVLAHRVARKIEVSEDAKAGLAFNRLT